MVESKQSRRPFSRLTRRTLLKHAGVTSTIVTGVARPGRTLAQAEEPVYGGTLTYGNAKPSVNIINPLNTVGTGQNVLIEALFLRLVYGHQWGDGMNPDLTTDIDLAVAETMTEIEKDRVWEFTLRQNVFWHDGTPVTADDVIFGIWWALNRDASPSNLTPPTGIKGANRLLQEGGGATTPPYSIQVEGATKLGDYAVRIELERPIPNYWVNSAVGYWPMPSHIFAGMPLDALYNEPYATMPIGNGPFKAVRYVDGQYMELAANEEFYLGRPYVDTFIVRFGEADTLSAALEAQEIDGASVRAGQVYDRLVSLDYLDGNPVPSDHPNGFVVNFERFPAQAAGLNKAIQHAVDIETISAVLFSGTLRPSNDLFAHIVGYEQSPAGFEARSYDPERAKAILQEIGWGADIELDWVLWAPPTPFEDALQAMLEEVGIKTKYRIIDTATIIDVYYRDYDFDISLGNFGASQFFTDNWKYIKCGWTYDEGGFNYARYCNEEVDSLWQQGLDEPGAVQQKEIFDQVNLELNASPPHATIYRGSVAYVWNTRVQGAYPYQYQLPVRPALERVWIKR